MEEKKCLFEVPFSRSKDRRLWRQTVNGRYRLTYI